MLLFRMMIICALGVWLLGAPARGDAPSSATLADAAATEGFLVAMREGLDGMRTLRADFVQRRSLEAFEDELESRGRVYFERPYRLRWETCEPYGALWLAQGGRAAAFERGAGGRLERLEGRGEALLARVLGEIGAWMRGDFDAARETYRLELRRGGGAAWLRLIPREAEGLGRVLRSIELQIRTGTYMVERVCITEPSGDRIVLDFLKTEKNQPLDAALFRFDPPLPIGAGEAGR